MKNNEIPDTTKMENAQKKRLFNLGLEAAHSLRDVDSDQVKAHYILDMLASKLPADPDIEENLPDLLRALKPKLRSVTGETIGTLLLSTDTNITDIKKIKDQAKQKGTAAKNESERDAFLAVYYAAIAYALVYHNKIISNFGSHELIQAFQYFCDQKWLTTDLIKLFRLALDQLGK